MIKRSTLPKIIRSLVLRRLTVVFLCLIIVACNQGKYVRNESVDKKEVAKQFASKQKDKKVDNMQAKNKKEILKDKDAEELFASSETVANEELGDIRGAYIASNGVTVDIGFLTQTLVNGNLVNHMEFDSGSQQSFSGMQQMIKIAQDGSIEVEHMDASNASSFVTLIQNAANDQVVQHFNILNLDISNVQSFRQQGLVPTLNFHSSF